MEYKDIQADVQLEIQNAIKKFAQEKQYGVAKIPAHQHTGIDALRVNYHDLSSRSHFLIIRIVASGTATSVANVVGGDYVMPYDGYVEAVGATVDTAGTTNATLIDVNKNGSTMLSTKINVDSAKKTSRTSATQPVINNTLNSFITGDIFTFDVDQISTTPANGLTIFMRVVETSP